MTITNLGERTLGEIIPAAQGLASHVNASVAVTLPNLEAELAGYVLTQASPEVMAPDVTQQLADCMSAFAALMADLANLSPALAIDVAAAVEGQLEVQERMGAFPDLAKRLAALLAAIAALKNQLVNGYLGVNVNLLVIANVISDLGSKISELKDSIGFAANVGGNLGATGVKLLRFDGNFSQIGQELQSELGATGPTGQGHALLLIPTTPEAWVALRATMKTA